MGLWDWGADILNRFWPHIASAFAAIVAIQTSQAWSVLRFINSNILSIWRFVARKPRTFTGNWLAVYEPPVGGHVTGRQVELLKCAHTTGNELSGSIRNEDTGDKYSFGGRFVFDEVVGHYWSESGNRDIGTFKLQEKAGSVNILSGTLTLYDSTTGKTREGMLYTWYRCPRWPQGHLLRMFKPTRAGFSEINGTGLIANVRFAQGEKIGDVKYRVAPDQGRYTIPFNGKHCLLQKPWRFVNHACEPSAQFVFDKTISLKALKEIFPQTEITCDYNALPEKPSERFICTCPKCRQSAKPAEIGVP